MTKSIKIEIRIVNISSMNIPYGNMSHSYSYRMFIVTVCGKKMK